MNTFKISNSCNSTYSEVVKQEKNTQGIFDRQIELCEFFAVMNSHVDVNYKVNNKHILIQVSYDKNSQWNANQGKRTLWKLVEKYKLELIGYDKHSVRFTKLNTQCTKKKLFVSIQFPLTSSNFDINVFSFSKAY